MHSEVAVDRRAPLGNVQPAVERLVGLVKWPEGQKADPQNSRRQGPEQQKPSGGPASAEVGRQPEQSKHQHGVRRVVPAIDGPKRPQSHRQSGHRKSLPCNAGGPESRYEIQTQAEDQYRKRDNHHVSVEVREQEGEERELGDVEGDVAIIGDRFGHPKGRERWVKILQGRHHPAAAPKIKAGEWHAVDSLNPDSLNDLDNTVQVADNTDKQGRYQPGGYAAPPPRQTPEARPGGRGRLLRYRQRGMAADSFHQVVNQRIGAGYGQREEERHRQVERGSRQDSCDPDDSGEHGVAPVVVVQVAAGKPGVEGRQGSGAHHRVEVRQLHRFLPAPVRVPQVWVGVTQGHERQEGCQEYRFSRQDKAPPGSEEFDHLAPPERPRSRRQQRQRRQGEVDRGPGEISPAKRDHQPGNVGDRQQAQYPGEDYAPVG